MTTSPSIVIATVAALLVYSFGRVICFAREVGRLASDSTLRGCVSVPRSGLGNVEPTLPSPVKAPPSGPDWTHEIKP